MWIFHNDNEGLNPFPSNAFRNQKTPCCPVSTRTYWVPENMACAWRIYLSKYWNFDCPDSELIFNELFVHYYLKKNWFFTPLLAIKHITLLYSTNCREISRILRWLRKATNNLGQSSHNYQANSQGTILLLLSSFLAT